MSDKEQRPADRAASASPGRGGQEAALSVVSGLMDERRRYESWIAALEARRATTDDRVYVRVHADYTARLEAVINQLSSHADGLRGELTSLAVRLSALRERQHQAREERAEAELRAHVGELSEGDWEQTAAAADARMAALDASHSVLEQELHRTRELLADAERPSTSGSSVEIPPALRSPTPSAPSAPTPADRTEVQAAVFPQPGAPDPARGRTSFDELAFLSSVVDTPGAAAGRTRPPGKPADTYVTTDLSDESIENRDGAAGASVSARTGGDKPMAANVSGNTPIVIKDKAVDATKTLRCAECSAMNYPTEWYCERCGAELASL